MAVWGEVFVQFWLRPGERAAVFEVGNEPPADPIPGELGSGEQWNSEPI